MVIRCFSVYDWSRSYLLPESVTANIPLRGSIGEPGSYNAARGLLVEVGALVRLVPGGTNGGVSAGQFVPNPW